MNKLFLSEIVASTDLHAGGYLFGLLFCKKLKFESGGIVFLEKEVVDEFNPMDKSDVSHLNSYRVKGNWEILKSSKIKCKFESIFLEMHGIESPNKSNRLIFHCFDSRLSKQWGEVYTEKKQ